MPEHDKLVFANPFDDGLERFWRECRHDIHEHTEEMGIYGAFAQPMSRGDLVLATSHMAGELDRLVKRHGKPVRNAPWRKKL